MFTLDEVVPWGRSFDEYRHMFALDARDLSGLVLGCGDGPASFNAEASRRGHRVVSVDPLYRFSTGEIHDRIVATYATVLEQTRQHASQFVWKTIRSVDDLGHVRMDAMRTFLRDFEPGRRRGRYLPAALPALPFRDRVFDLALCSHVLFLYSEQLTAAVHQEALTELCRVAAEVRVFPLLALDGRRSPHVDAAVTVLTTSGYHVTIERVPYEFQRGGHEMMRVRHSTIDNVHQQETADGD